jgi:hypothetical protein
MSNFCFCLSRHQTRHQGKRKEATFRNAVKQKIFSHPLEFCYWNFSPPVKDIPESKPQSLRTLAP